MIIDIHTHIYTEETYQTYLSKTKGRELKVLVMAWHEQNLEDLLSFISTKNNLFLVGTVNIESNINEQLEKLEKLFREKKIFGIKLYPGYQYFYPSDEKVYPTADLCQKYNKPLIFHSGTTYSVDKKALFKYAHPIYIDELAVKFPKCKIIISHFGFPYQLETATVIYKNENVFTEISGTIERLSSKEDARDILNQYIKDLSRVFSYYPEVKKKVMFGTDYSGEDTSLCEVAPYIKLVERVFRKDEQKNVFYSLAENLFFKE
ncbi:MAG: amidohydrolase family protein [Candidatus Nealsonbacteria bacterium]|nr:amidohydrolase family protein [Candidatus Nealsonbacteria bacterium]